MNEEAVRAVIVAAGQIRSGTMGIIEGSRLITRLRFHLPDPNAEYLLPFRGVESETDDLPVGEERRHWNAEALLEKDKLIQEYESRIRADISQECGTLIEALSSIEGR